MAADRRRGDSHRRTTHRPTIPSAHRRQASDRAEDQELIQTFRRAMRSDSPVDLLGLVSAMVMLSETTSADASSESPGSSSLRGLVDSFIDFDIAETTAVLTVIRSLTTDEVLRARLQPVIAARRQPMPDWLASLDRAEIGGVRQLTDILGDGDDYFVEARLPSGDRFTALVYVDHNMGTVVKDAFVGPTSLEELLDVVQSHGESDQELRDFDPAIARAVIRDAIDRGDLFDDPIRTDTWPACRLLVEWLVRLLPPGGRVPDIPEWSNEQLDELADEFFSSAYGKAVDGADERQLVELFLRLGAQTSSGDPLRWSEVNLELLLTHWIPDGVWAPEELLIRAPEVLRPFVRFCHAHEGIPADRTSETLASVDRYESLYYDLVHTESRIREGQARIDVLYGGSDEGPAIAAIMLKGLDRQVGGRSNLVELDDAALPDEPFDWAQIPDDVHAPVAEVLELCNRCADELFDVEHRTAFRRFLARATAADSAIFRRKRSMARTAAAVCWVVGKANDTVAGPHGRVQAKDLLEWFGVSGSGSQLAEPFIRAVGVDPHQLYGAMDLGSPDFLVSEMRRWIIDSRDKYLAQLDEG